MQNELHYIDTHIMNWLTHLDDVIPQLIKDMSTDTRAWDINNIMVLFCKFAVAD